MDEHRRRLPVVVVFLEAPSIIHGHTRLPVLIRRTFQDFLFGSAKVAGGIVVLVHPLHSFTALTHSVVDDEVRFEVP